MHQLLLISELLELIFEYIDEPATYAQLASVCKDLKEPSLDALYADVRCFPRFLTCMPSDLWCIQNQRFGFKRDVIRDDWDKLYSYAKRVKTVVVEKNNRDIFVADEVAEALLKLSPFPTLFPQLHTLYIYGYEHFEPIHYVLMAPTLRSLYVRDIETSCFLDGAPDLPTLCPLIEYFSCWDNGNLRLPGRMKKMTDTLSRLNCLRSVDCGPLDADVVEHLSGVKHLSSIRAPVIASDSWIGLHVGIPALDDLRLQVDTFETFSQAVWALFTHPLSESHADQPLARLRSVTMNVSQLPGTAPITGPSTSPSLITSALAACVSPENLTTIKLADYWTSTQTTGRFTHADLAPLCVFAHLTSLTIKFQSQPLSLDDAQLADLIVHWPRLTSLHLAKLERPLNLASLIAVLRACPDLRQMELLIKAEPTDVTALLRDPTSSDGIVYDDTTGCSLPCNTYVTWMDMYHATEEPEDAVPFARLLHRILPSLKSCDRSVSSNSDAVSAQEARQWLEHTRRTPNGRAESFRGWRTMFWQLVFALMRGEEDLGVSGDMGTSASTVIRVRDQFRSLLGHVLG
ncbi:hypothetical protein CONPUDRAFT_164378 [Coniophora puteana RWD-64-598 SS2]|uniref:F-box domain-containing protein n=1 Tax=Coniophora puteana (strain RWD-64-598) TaxID=741705 RepID=A0A5M3MWD6_CONPW|nr:uncharacterized protein CONPUDRAFT_164378 [Coniophora puteana RWD-64-598 SS2]EIW83426.1 hypothetical protein CONPUDRAFT_164378 [Coniophora puteana RWD-64-598 SS2]